MAVDALGLTLAVFVCVADVDDATAARGLISQLNREAQTRLELMWPIASTTTTDYPHLELHPRIGWKLAIVRRLKNRESFVVLPKRGGVERTYAWQDGERRPSKDDGKHTASAEAWPRINSINRMLRLFINRLIETLSNTNENRKLRPPQLQTGIPDSHSDRRLPDGRRDRVVTPVRLLDAADEPLRRELAM